MTPAQIDALPTIHPLCVALTRARRARDRADTAYGACVPVGHPAARRVAAAWDAYSTAVRAILEEVR